MNEQKTVKADQALFSTDIPNLYEGIIVCNNKGFIAKVSPTVEKILGYKGSQLRGKTLRSFLHKDDRRSFDEILKEVLSKKDNSKNMMRRVRRESGRYLWIEAQLTNLLQKKGIGGIVINFKDISEQKETARTQFEAQQSLINSHHFLENIINTVAAPIFVKDEKHRWILFNNAFLRGRDPNHVLGKSDDDIMTQAQARRIWKVDNEVLQTGRTITTEELVPMGEKSLRTVITTKSRFIDDKGGKYVIGFIMDITERKRFEDVIKNINAQLRAVIESTKDQILSLDLHGNYTMFNQAHGETIRHLTGKEIKVGDNLIASLPKTLKKVVQREIKKALAAGSFFSELKYPDKTVFKMSYSTINGDKNQPTGIAVFAEDITERKLTEIKLRTLNDELRQQNEQLAFREEELQQALHQLSERNFELDQLMYKTSHDLRSPLSSILGLVNLANLDPNKSNVNNYLHLIEGRIKKLDEFINSMLNYGRVNRGEIKITRINLREVVNNVIRQLEHLENFRSVRIRLTIKNEEMPFNNDALLVNIMVSNIISNAYKYYNPEVPSFLKIKINITGQFVTLGFTDNGIGIQKEHLDKIFNMFYRATDRSQGSGLGMYIVKQAAEKVNGSVSIKSEYGEGTEIKFKLPNL